MARPAKNKSTDPVTDYARQVVGGKIVAGKLVRAACQRHLNDLKDGHKRGLIWCPEVALRHIGFFSYLQHSKGEFAGKVFELGGWQKFRIGCTLGWFNIKDGTRRFKTSYNEVARKNGKSQEAAGIALDGLIADGEQGAEVYSAATKRDQARIVFAEAARMARRSPDIREKLRVFKPRISVESTNSIFEPLSSDARTLDGLNPSRLIVDELHKHSSRDLLDVLDTALGARRQPLMWIITTAGNDDPETVYAQEHHYAEQVALGVIEDDTYFAYIATLDEGDRWDDELVWIKANPNLGVSVNIEDLRRQVTKAKGSPAAKNAFMRLRLNVRTSSAVKAIPLEQWRACTEGPLDEADLYGRRCFAAFDISKKTDLTAAVLFFPPIEEGERWKLISKFWMPSDNVTEREEGDRASYSRWIEQGWIEPTPGNVIDQKYVFDQIMEWNRNVEIVSCPYDHWDATRLALDLQNEGVPVVEFIQGLRSYSHPTKEFLNLVVAKKLEHGGNPVLEWMANNLKVETDKNLGMMPHKKKSIGRIDGVVAAIMAYGAAIDDTSGDGYSPTRGLQTLG